MAISFVGSASNAVISGGDVTVTLPGGMAANDLILVGYGIADNDSVDEDMAIVSPSGYTEVADLFANDLVDTNLGVFYKYHNGTDTDVVADGLGGADAAVSAVLMVFRGVALSGAGGPFDTAATTATGIDTGVPNPPSINTTGASGIWTVIVGASGSGHITDTPSLTAPANYTTNAVQIAIKDTSDIAVGMGYRTNPSDPEDPGSFTLGGVPDDLGYSWCAVTMALKESVGGGPIIVVTAVS